MGNFSKQLFCPNRPHFLQCFCNDVKIFHFSSEIYFGQLLYTFGNFLKVTLASTLNGSKGVCWIRILYYTLMWPKSSHDLWHRVTCKIGFEVLSPRKLLQWKRSNWSDQDKPLIWWRLISVTRWLDYFCNICSFTAMKISPMAYKIYQSGFQTFAKY